MGQRGCEKKTIDKKLYFSIVSKEKLSIDSLYAKLRHLRRLIEFACQTPLEHSELSLIGDINNLSNTYELYLSETLLKEKKSFDRRMELFGKGSIPRDFGSMLIKWFELESSHKEPLERFFDAMNHRSSSNVLTFLWLVSAIEEMHKINTGKRGKKPHLKERIEDTCKEWEKIINVERLEEHIEKIKDTRHYYAHGAADLREKSVHDWAMMRYSYFLIGLLNLEILKLLGCTTDKAIEISNKTFWMKEYLSLSMFPGDD